LIVFGLETEKVENAGSIEVLFVKIISGKMLIG
jgi:hypothetical protein